MPRSFRLRPMPMVGMPLLSGYTCSFSPSSRTSSSMNFVVSTGLPPFDETQFLFAQGDERVHLGAHVAEHGRVRGERIDVGLAVGLPLGPARVFALLVPVVPLLALGLGGGLHPVDA